MSEGCLVGPFHCISTYFVGHGWVSWQMVLVGLRNS